MDTAFEPGPGSAARVSTSAASGARSALHRDTPLLETVERVFATLGRMAGDYAHLVVMDVRRASLQLAWLVASVIVIAVLVVTAWLALVTALAVWLLGHNMSWPAVLAVAAVLNLIGAGGVVLRVKGVFGHAPFSATLKQLKSKPAAGEGEP